MDNFYTVLLYVGGLLLIMLFKSISKSGKKEAKKDKLMLENAQIEQNEASFVPFTQEIFPFNFDEAINQINNVNIQSTTKYRKDIEVKNIEPQNLSNHSAISVTPVQKEEVFILGEFDIKAAIIYSEIFQHTDY